MVSRDASLDVTTTSWIWCTRAVSCCHAPAGRAGAAGAAGLAWAATRGATTPGRAIANNLFFICPCLYVSIAAQSAGPGGIARPSLLGGCTAAATAGLLACVLSMWRASGLPEKLSVTSCACPSPSAVCRRGEKRRLQLRDSPGFPPGSLLMALARTSARPTNCGCKVSANIGEYKTKTSFFSVFGGDWGR